MENGKRIIDAATENGATLAGIANMKALKVWTLIKNDFLKALDKCDVLVGPTMPSTAFKIGELVDNPLQMYMVDILTCPINIAGVPSISILSPFLKSLASYINNS